jgi:hypothetical protein
MDSLHALIGKPKERWKPADEKLGQKVLRNTEEVMIKPLNNTHGQEDK